MPIDHGDPPSIDPHETNQQRNQATMKRPKSTKAAVSEEKTNEKHPEGDKNEMDIDGHTRAPTVYYSNRVNVEVKITRAIKTISACKILSRILAAIRKVDSYAIIFGTDENEQEIKSYCGC